MSEKKKIKEEKEDEKVEDVSYFQLFLQMSWIPPHSAWKNTPFLVPVSMQQDFDQNKLEEEMRKRKERVEKWREEQRKKAIENIGEIKKELEEMKQGKKWSLEDDDGEKALLLLLLLERTSVTLSYILVGLPYMPCFEEKYFYLKMNATLTNDHSVF